MTDEDEKKEEEEESSSNEGKQSHEEEEEEEPWAEGRWAQKAQKSAPNTDGVTDTAHFGPFRCCTHLVTPLITF